MDGYIKNKQGKIAEQRKSIIYAYCHTLPIVLILFTCLCILGFRSPPEKWKSEQVVFSHISTLSVGRGSRRVFFHTTDGQRFQITSHFSRKETEQVLIPGQRYMLTYSPDFPYKYTRALRTEDNVLVSYDESLKKHENFKKTTGIILTVLSVLEGGSLVLIDRLACKNMYAEIKKLKQDIAIREEKLRKRKEKESTGDS